jgi:predicted nuclease with TOPRIM domain
MLMAVMMSPRERWTDERLDDLSVKVDRGFADLKAEMKEGFERVDKRFAQVDKRFERIDKRFERIEDRLDKLTDRFESLNRTLWGGAFVIAAALIGSSAF